MPDRRPELCAAGRDGQAWTAGKPTVLGSSSYAFSFEPCVTPKTWLESDGPRLETTRCCRSHDHQYELFSLSAKDPEADIIREQIKEVVSILSTKKMTPLVLPRMKFILTGLIREMKSREMLEVALDDEKVEKAVLPQILILDPISEGDRQAKLDLLLDLTRDITDAQQKVGVIDALLSHALEEVGKSSVDPNKWAAALYRDIRKRFAENSDKVEEKRKWKILIDISSQELSFAKDARMISFLQGFLDLLERGVPHDTPARLQTVVTAPPSAPKSEESKKESKATISPPGGWLRFMSLGTLSFFLTVYGLWMAISDARHQRQKRSRLGDAA